MCSLCPTTSHAENDFIKLRDVWVAGSLILCLLSLALVLSKMRIDVVVCHDARGLLFVGHKSSYSILLSNGFIPSNAVCSEKSITRGEWDFLSKTLRAKPHED